MDILTHNFKMSPCQEYEGGPIRDVKNYFASSVRDGEVIPYKSMAWDGKDSAICNGCIEKIGPKWERFVPLIRRYRFAKKEYKEAKKSMEELSEFHRECVEELRVLEPRLRMYDEYAVYSTYSEWSDIYHAAGWLDPCEEKVREYYEWATRKPLGEPCQT
jgi:hypothetical protein